MPAYNFKKQFAPKVEDGSKPHTIRPRRKRRTVVGDPLYLYTGMRTKHCRKLRDTVCVAVKSISFWPGRRSHVQVCLDGKTLTISELLKLSAADGFSSIAEFLEFFRSNYGIPHLDATLELIQWDPSVPTS